MLIINDTGDENIAALYADTPISGPHPNLWNGPPVTADHWHAAVIKMHEGSEEAYDAITSRSAISIVTVRDPRDAIVSVMQRFKWDFDTAFEHVYKSLHFADQLLQLPSTLVLRYEDYFMREPQSIYKIAAHLHIDIDDHRIMQIFSALNPESIDKLTRDYQAEDRMINIDTAGRLYDKSTHWHQQHYGDGSVGKWRKYLSRRERKKIRASCWKEITRMGYAGLGW
jgi:hypothetical protein